MKISIVSILILIISAGTHAQDFIYAVGQHRLDTVINENYESYEIQVATPVAEDITFKWEVLSNTFDPNWSCSICDYSGCYVGFPPSATMTAITAAEMAGGTHGFIKCNITCGLNYGDGKVEIYIYDQNDYSRGDTVSFSIHWPAPASAIAEHKISLLTYPNPVLDQLIIENLSDINGTIVITDILGKKMRHNRLGANAIEQIDVSDLRKGVYLVSVIGKNGIQSSKKIIKK
ncbi:MAG: T9SS type A sorting domain-containing protein [Flavobacteriales bacterium]|nr:T9SS type A sorting domain-containing protein [Flavobacteriales bacterium]